MLRKFTESLIKSIKRVAFQLIFFHFSLESLKFIINRYTNMDRGKQTDKDTSPKPKRDRFHLQIPKDLLDNRATSVVSSGSAPVTIKKIRLPTKYLLNENREKDLTNVQDSTHVRQESTHTSSEYKSDC